LNWTEKKKSDEPEITNEIEKEKNILCEKLSIDEQQIEERRIIVNILIELHASESENFKKKVIQIIANLKNNATLREKVLNGKITPKELIHMNSFEMAKEERKKGN